MNEATSIEWDALKSKLSSVYQLDDLTFSAGEIPVKIFSVANSYALLDGIDSAAFREDERMPYWAEVWASSVALAQEMCGTKSLAGKRCLELGAGVGTASVALAKCGAQVTATDYFDEALDFIRLNALTNAVTLDARWLDWRRITLTGNYDVIAAADVLYERRNHLPVLEAIEKLLAPGGAALIADPQRALAQNFLSLSRENGYEVSTVVRTAAVRDRPQEVDIHRLTKLV